MSSEASQKFGIASEISTFIDAEIEKLRVLRKAKEAQKEKERLETEAKSRLAEEKWTLIKTQNEKGEKIITASGARELIERARISLLRLYPNITTAEGWGDKLIDEIFYGIYDNLPPTVQYRHVSVPAPLINEATKETQREQIIKQRREEQRKPYEQGKRLYKVRLAWPLERLTPLRNIMDLTNGTGYGQVPYDDALNYIDVFGDGWTNRLVVVSGNGLFSKKEKVFEEEEWRDRQTPGYAILEAIKNPCYWARYRPRGKLVKDNRPMWSGYGGGGG